VCLCRKAYVEGDLMVGCDSCDEWFHLNCIQMSKETADRIEAYKCNDCEQKERHDSVCTHTIRAKKQKQKQKQKQLTGMQHDFLPMT
jgi:hypothetical protein